MVARANGQAVNIADANTPLAAADNNETDAVNIDDDQVPLAVREDADEVATSIEDETVPLASGASQEAKRRLWWWVLAIVGSITGKTSYDKKNKKGIFKEVSTAQNTDESDKE
jgi:hypothetical protein